MTDSVALDGLWTINEKCRRRKSSNGINMVFIPGQNVVLELNVVAGHVLDIVAGRHVTFEDVLAALSAEYEIEDEAAFKEDVQQLFERFVRHEVCIRNGAQP